MAKRLNLGILFPLALSLILMPACMTLVTPPQGTYYVVPVVSYLRECPEYDCKVVSELYRADAMEFLDRKGNEWWQMRSQRTDRTGWIQSNLLSPIPVSMQTFYVIPKKLPLRECPTKDCPVSKTLLQGEDVQKIDENKEGWWRVLAGKDRIIGWIPADQVSETSAKVAIQPPKENFMFVAPASLNLHFLPLISSRVVKVLSRNDKVEKLYASGSEWLKVRHTSSGAEGWTMAHSLKEAPVPAESQIILKKKKSKKEPVRKKPSKEELPESEPIKPEVM